MRWVSQDGRWRVDRIQLAMTGTGHDGWWYRVSEFGYYVGEARDWDGVARLGANRKDLRKA